MRAFSAYVHLTKPGIILGNAITATCGYFIAARGALNPLLFFEMLLGLSCIIAAACVANNYLDRAHDAKMKRTRQRALVTGEISARSALVYSICLGVAGIALLLLYTNPLTLTVSLFAVFVYLGLYSFIKYYSPAGTLIGSIAGGIPPVVGYLSVQGVLDLRALLLFAIIALWQMPHFYAIALFRQEEYAAAKIPVLPLVKGVKTTQRRMLFYIVAFTLAATTPFLIGMAGPLYLTVVLLLGILWLTLWGRPTENVKVWAHKMFRFSLVVVTLLSIFLAIGA